MKILFIGDIVGRSGREAVISKLPELRKKNDIDVVIANAENAVSGYGLNKKIANELFDNNVDLITLGNHSWDQKEMLTYIEECPRIIRPLNYPEGVPGKGDFTIQLKDGRSLLVIQVMLRLFMGISLDDPFASLSNRLKKEQLGKTCNGILIDMHGETTSEKNAFGHYFDGKVSAIIGTHTHVPTADARILKGKTAYQTDAGMTGNYNSVIGFKKDEPIHAFIKGYRIGGRFEPAQEKGELCGCIIDISDETGLAKDIQSFKI
ncbi:MAG: hypothetical protein CFH19_00569 [Alphaproteobacteria bacterium MarineAlpha5_Bin9]|nr:MAG: hypothetical protein CFH19_00569 [Alphaproteobacteria bacterium MarineAlpha5_Bin9]|tara:strand:+ start:15898 stop:16686 length:789 start_codon:yes stop_codon:yes gene_type:complete